MMALRWLPGTHRDPRLLKGQTHLGYLLGSHSAQAAYSDRRFQAVAVGPRLSRRFTDEAQWTFNI